MPFDVFLKHILKFFFFIFNSDETMGAELGVNKGTSQVVINWSLLCSSLFFHLHSPPDGFFFFFQNQDNVFWNAFKWNPPSETSLCPHASRKVCFWHVPLRKLSAELKWKNCLCFYSGSRLTHLHLSPCRENSSRTWTCHLLNHLHLLRSVCGRRADDASGTLVSQKFLNELEEHIWTDSLHRLNKNKSTHLLEPLWNLMGVNLII